MEFIRLLWSDYTLRTVALGTLILGAGSGALGSFALVRKQSLLGDAVSHSALPGIALAYLFTLQREPQVLLVGALVAGWLGASLVNGITRHSRIDADGALALILSVFFGGGLMLLSHIQRLPGAGKAGLDKYLFGQAAALVTSDLWIIGIVEGLALVLAFVFWKELKAGSFDPAYASTQGIPRRLVDGLLTALFVVSIVVGLSTVGVILMSALMVGPAAAARQWTKRLGPMVLLAGFFGAVSGLVGALLSSFVPDTPTGPAVVLTLAVINILALLGAPHRGLVSRMVQDWTRDRIFAQRRLLLDMHALGLRHQDMYHPHGMETLRIMRGSRNIRPALKALELRGLMTVSGSDQWSLTPEGLHEALKEYGHES